MTVSLIRVRSLTWATLRPARSRASAKAAPMDTPRRQGCTAPRTAPPASTRAVPGPSGHATPTADRPPRPASGEPPSQPTTGTPTAVPAPAPRLPENAPGAGRCDPGDQLHGPHRRPGALPVPVPPAATGPSSAARTHRSPSQPPARSAHHQPAAPHISATRTQPPAQSTHPIPAHTRHAAATTARPAGSPHP